MNLGVVYLKLQDRLKELRKENNLKQEEIAEKLSITTSAYGFYEQGKTIPNATTITFLADLYDVSTDYLLGITNIRKSNNKEPDDLTIAAHHEGNNWTPEELEEIEKFKEFVKAKRKL